MNFSGPVGSCYQAIEERNELLSGVPPCGHAMHLTGLDIQSCIQRKRAVAIVFKPMPFGPSRRQRQHRIQTIQGLNRRLLIYAEHRRVLWPIHVQTDDVGGGSIANW